MQPPALVRRTWRRLGAGALCLTLSACTLSRPHYKTPPGVAVGEPAFLRTVEAQTDAELVRGNRAHVLRNGDEIFPAMLAAIREAKQTITFANFVYEKGDIARDMTDARRGTGARPTCASRDRSCASCRPPLPRTGATPRASCSAATRTFPSCRRAGR